MREEGKTPPRATEAHENEQQQQNGEKKGFPPSGMVLVKLVEPWVMQDDPCGVHCVNWGARGAPGASGGTRGAREGTLVRAPTRYAPWSSHGHCHLGDAL